MINLSNNKFKAKRQIIDGHNFASTLEANCYSVLKKLCLEFKLTLKLQDARVIKPKSHIYPAMFWRVDFGIYDSQENLILLIESKGYETNQFSRGVKFFEFFNPDDYQKLILVVSEDKELDQLKKLKLPIYRLDNGFKTKIRNLLIDKLSNKIIRGKN